MKLQNFLVEANRRKIYFAHPRAFYDKPEEKKAIAMIMKEFPEHIIVNPNVDWIQGRVDDMGFDIFFKVINTVEFVVAMPFPDGKMGNGTWREIEYADKKGKDIYVVRPQKNTLEKTAKNKIKWLTPEETYERIPKKEQHMWKMYEAKLTEFLYEEKYSNKFASWFTGTVLNNTKHPTQGEHQLTPDQIKKSNASYKNKLWKNIDKAMKSSDSDTLKKKMKELG